VTYESRFVDDMASLLAMSAAHRHAKDIPSNHVERQLLDTMRSMASHMHPDHDFTTFAKGWVDAAQVAVDKNRWDAHTWDRLRDEAEKLQETLPLAAEQTEEQPQSSHPAPAHGKGADAHPGVLSYYPGPLGAYSGVNSTVHDGKVPEMSRFGERPEHSSDQILGRSYDKVPRVEKNVDQGEETAGVPSNHSATEAPDHRPHGHGSAPGHHRDHGHPDGHGLRDWIRSHAPNDVAHPQHVSGNSGHPAHDTGSSGHSTHGSGTSPRPLLMDWDKPIGAAPDRRADVSHEVPKEKEAHTGGSSHPPEASEHHGGGQPVQKPEGSPSGSSVLAGQATYLTSIGDEFSLHVDPARPGYEADTGEDFSSTATENAWADGPAPVAPGADGHPGEGSAAPATPSEDEQLQSGQPGG
jgi:hypothetical protein